MKNRFWIKGDVGVIELISLGKRFEALVDAADIPLVDRYPNAWRAQQRYKSSETSEPYHCVRGVWEKGGRIHRVYMHRWIMNPPAGLVVDHINGDGLDNRRVNLRVCRQSENARNMRYKRGRSKFKGVWWCEHLCKWRAAIRAEGKRIHLGLFESEVEAAKVYDNAARELFGEFARPNFADQGEAVSE